MKTRSGNRAESRLAALLLALLASACGPRCGESRDGIAAAADGAAAKAAEESPAACIDGERALADVRRIAAIGPRPPGSPGAEAIRRFIVGRLRELGLEPVEARFTAYTPHPDHKQIEFVNITVDIGGPGRRVLLGGHYDAKLLPEAGFVGANDSGSSTALLLEIARCLRERGAPVPVRVAFFDGEEALVTWSDADGLYGSKRMAAALAESGERARIAAMVNLDMIGDRDLHLFRETLSTPWVLDAIVRAAERLGHAHLFDGPRAAIEDDHLPFLRIGVPAADLIDLEFGPTPGSNDYWHTAADTPDKLSAASLETVGEVVVEALPELLRGPPAPRDQSKQTPL